MNEHLDPRIRQQMAKMGTPIRFGHYAMGDSYLPTRHMALVFSRIMPLLLSIGPSQKQRFFYVHCPVRHSKALDVETPIPTPEGWTTMGGLAVGDEVFDEAGIPCRVTAIHEQGYRPGYSVEFDGSIEPVIADADHLWTTLDIRACENHSEAGNVTYGDSWPSWRPRRGNRGPRTVTTAEIASSLVDRRGHTNHRIPVAGALGTPETNLPIDPWVLGYWLGNGRTRGGELSVGGRGDESDLDHVVSGAVAAGYRVTVARKKNQLHGFSVRPIGLQRELRLQGLLGDKRIPMAYLRASALQRRALLAGLMDSDGHCMKDGTCWFGNMDEALARSVHELFVSLGSKAVIYQSRATLNGVDHGEVWTVRSNSTFNPFTLKRKGRRWRGSDQPKFKKRCHRMVTAVRPLGVDVRMRCIEVDSPNRLFLAGRDMIPTHNSVSISRVMTAWFHGMRPTLDSMLISKADELAKEHGRAARDLLKEFGPELFGVKVSPDNTAADRWAIEKHGGTMRSVGIDGDIIGRGAHLLVLDDPFKNPESPSKAESDKLWGRWNGTIRSRLMPGGVCVAIFSRWGDDDLWGRWQESMAQGGDQWEEIWLPALAECPEGEDPDLWVDELGRSDGEALWPEMWPKETLESLRAASYANDGGFTWESQYQGRPMGRSGGLFERERWEMRPPAGPEEIKESIRAWDLAATARAGDWTVGARLDRLWNGKTIISDIKRVRRHAGEVEELVVRTAVEDGTTVKIRMEQERAGAGKATTARYATILSGFDFKALTAAGDKEERARGLASQQFVGNVYVVDRTSWTEALVVEFERFPRGKHDDQVDACALAFNCLSDFGAASMTDQSYAERELTVPGMQGLMIQDLLDESEYAPGLFTPLR